MDILFQTHHADVPAALRDRAAHAIERLAPRLRRPEGATVRFAADGPTRRVEILLRAPSVGTLVACGEAQAFPQALARALARLRARLPRRNDGRSTSRSTLSA